MSIYENEYEITGRIDQIMPEDSNGQYFNRTIVLQTNSQGRTQNIKVTFSESLRDRGTLLYQVERYNQGDQVHVTFTVQGNYLKNSDKLWVSLKGIAITD